MDEDAARPQLDAGVYQSIEFEQYDIHKRYLAALKELQVLPASEAGEAIWPRDPGRLSRVLDAYARALYDAEAKRYPAGPERNLWLRSLAGRIEALASRRIWDQDTVSAAKLTYHATREEIDGLIRAALQSYVDEQIAPPPLPQIASSLEGLAAAAGDRPHEHPPASWQIRSLRREARLTVDELADQVGIASRSVQRHESGEVAEIRLRHLRQYERVFTALLKRPVRIEEMEQAQRYQSQAAR